jgi:hypothetical protein
MLKVSYTLPGRHWLGPELPIVKLLKDMSLHMIVFCYFSTVLVESIFFFLNDAGELRVISLRRELQGRGQRPIQNPPPECYKGRVERPIPKSHTAPKLKVKNAN